MFGRRDTKADKAYLDREYLRQQADAAWASTREAAHHARDWAEPQYERARDWVEPRAKSAYRKSARKASPYVSRAGDKAEQWADAAHAAIVGSAIPAIVAAVRRAGEEPEEEKQGANWAAVVIPVAVAAAIGTAVVMWARRDPGVDRWAEESDEDWEFRKEQRDRLERVRTSINSAVDAAGTALRHTADVVATAASAAAAAVAEAIAPAAKRMKDATVAEAKKVAEAAGPTAAKVKDATVAGAKKVADQAGPTATKVKDATVAEAKKFGARVRAARDAVADEAERAMDDVEDVWGEEIAEATRSTSPAAKKTSASTARKSPAKKSDS